MKQKTENRKPITNQLFGIPISITPISQALALIGEWVREYRSVIGSRLSVIGSLPSRQAGKSAGFQSIGQKPKPTNRKPVNPKQRTENRELITGFPKIIVTPNPEIIVAAQSDPEFLQALQGADLSIPDGIGIVWALEMLGYRFSVIGSRLQVSQLSVSQSKTDKPKTDKPESENRKQKTDNWELSRLSGLDLMESLISDLSRTLLQGLSSKESPLKVMLLGGRPGIAQQAAEKFRHLKRPGLSRKGQAFIQSISGPKDITLASKKEIDNLISSVNRFRPDLLFVAFGHGKQEKWLTANREQLTAGVAIGVGGAFDQIADPSLRPPLYINSIGLGWLYRLIRQPWRWRRQLALLKFVWMVFQERLKS